MKTEFMVAITQLSAEKNLSKEVILAAVESALVSAYRKDTFAPDQDISVKIDPANGKVKVYINKAVVEVVTEPAQEISLTEAQKIDRYASINDTLSIEATPANAGRIAAQTARQVILQRLHEAEHHAIYEEFTCRAGDIITGTIQRITPDEIHVDLGKAEAILPINEQVHNERYRVGKRLKVYLLEVIRTNRGPQIIVSRAHRNLLRRLFELEVPEIHNGTVELKSVAREAGYRSKVAVMARQSGIDPVGCCVGLRGIRIQSIVSELNDEKIDVVQWVDDIKAFIANALSPAQVTSVEFDEVENTAVVTVPNKQLSLAIGKEGQNARLAAKLTGWRIDIKSVSAAEIEKASLSKEAVQASEVTESTSEVGELPVEAGEPVTGLVSESIPELIIAEDATVPEEAGEVKEEETPVAISDFELVLSDVSAEQPAVSPIRFAEDILPAKAAAAKKRAGVSKKDKEMKEGGLKPKKARSKKVSYQEEDDESDG